MIHESVIDKILKHALHLNTYGLDELGWTQQHAIDLIRNLMKEEIGILGGDVYIQREHRLDALPDSWYCEPLDNETRKDYYRRSKEHSLKYIEEFPVIPEEKCIFSMTFTEKLHD